MPKLDLGPVGVGMSSGGWDASLAAAPELEQLEYATLWLSGGQLATLDRVADTVRATQNVPVGTGIIPVDRYSPDAVVQAYAEIDAAQPGRFIVGLGGAHGPKPLHTLGAYLDDLDQASPAVPATSRVLAALGPRMLQLARDRSAGALPVLVTPDYTAEARAILGGDSTLAVQQLVVLDTDAARAREAARAPLRFLSQIPGYVANFRRMGFSEDDIAELRDPLVDALVSWGDVDAVAERVQEHGAAGADQVGLSVLTTDGSDNAPLDQWRHLAKRLIG